MNDAKKQGGFPILAFIAAIVLAFFNPLISLVVFSLGIIAGVDGLKEESEKPRAVLGIVLNVLGIIVAGMAWVLVELVGQL